MKKQLKIVRDETNACYKAYDGNICVASKTDGEQWTCFPGYELSLFGRKDTP